MLEPVGVVCAFVLAQERDDLCFVVAHKGVVVALEYGRLDIALCVADCEVLFELLGAVVAQTQLYGFLRSVGLGLECSGMLQDLKCGTMLKYSDASNETNCYVPSQTSLPSKPDQTPPP